jgi:carboxymethylenebutenolidase
MRSTSLTVAGAAMLAAAACHRSMSGEDHSSHTNGSSASASGTGAVGLPASGGAATARMAATSRRGEWIKVPFDPGSRDTIMTWISYPATSAKAPVVVVVHDINGLGVWTRAVADQAAAEGFIGVAPDFVSRLRGAPSTVELSVDRELARRARSS